MDVLKFKYCIPWGIFCDCWRAPVRTTRRERTMARRRKRNMIERFVIIVRMERKTDLAARNESRLLGMSSSVSSVVSNGTIVYVPVGFSHLWLLFDICVPLTMNFFLLKWPAPFVGSIGQVAAAAICGHDILMTLTAVVREEIMALMARTNSVQHLPS